MDAVKRKYFRGRTVENDIEKSILTQPFFKS